MGKKPHIVAIPFPVQGHVIPLMELCLCLAKNGCRVTFVNTEFNHYRIKNAMAKDDIDNAIVNLVSVPDGLAYDDDRNDIKKLTDSILEVVPGELESLIRRINESDDGENNVDCVIADENFGWAIDVAKRLGLHVVAFWPAAAATLATLFSAAKLVDDGIVGPDGEPLKKQSIQLAPEMPEMNPSDFGWNFFRDPPLRTLVFKQLLKSNESVKSANWILCNTSHEIENGALTLYPQIVPIGPLLANNRSGTTSGNFWPKNTDCLKWLDQQPQSSVVYVAFGSHTIFNREEFRELALGLELTNRPFLWVVRQGFIEESSAENVYPEGFIERTQERGRIVEWAPQQKVLAHPSVECFLSHCGWNSTMEGVSSGLPFLCWPYFADQYFNKSYICDVWKTGLGFERNKDGVVGRQEVKNKVEQLFGNENYRV